MAKQANMLPFVSRGAMFAMIRITKAWFVILIIIEGHRKLTALFRTFWNSGCQFPRRHLLYNTSLYSKGMLTKCLATLTLCMTAELALIYFISQILYQSALATYQSSTTIANQVLSHCSGHLAFASTNACHSNKELITKRGTYLGGYWCGVLVFS